MNTIRPGSHPIRKLGIGLGAASLLIAGLLAIKSDGKSQPNPPAIPSAAATEVASHRTLDARKLDRLTTILRIRQRLLQIQQADSGRPLFDPEEPQLGTDKFDVLFGQPILSKDDHRAIFVERPDFSIYLKVDEQGYVVDEAGLPFRTAEMALQEGSDISSIMDPSTAPGNGREGMEPLPPELLDFAVMWTPDFDPENVSSEFIQHLHSHKPDIIKLVIRTQDPEIFSWPPAP